MEGPERGKLSISNKRQSNSIIPIDEGASTLFSFHIFAADARIMTAAGEQSILFLPKKTAVGSRAFFGRGGKNHSNHDGNCGADQRRSAPRGDQILSEISTNSIRGGHREPPLHEFQPNLFSLRLFVTTDTLDNDIAALAMMGESSQPVSG